MFSILYSIIYYLSFYPVFVYILYSLFFQNLLFIRQEVPAIRDSHNSGERNGKKLAKLKRGAFLSKKCIIHQSFLTMELLPNRGEKETNFFVFHATIFIAWGWYEVDFSSSKNICAKFQIPRFPVSSKKS